MDLSSGYALDHKSDSARAGWSESRNRGPRTPMLPTSYLDRELGAVREEHEAVKRGGDKADARSKEV